MKFTRLIAAALGTLTVAGAVVMSSSGVVHAHHGNIEGVPRCTESGWAVDWRLWVTENRDVWKVSESGWQPADEWVPVRPAEFRSRTKTTTHSSATASATQAGVDVTWAFTDGDGNIGDQFTRPIEGLTIQKPEDCAGPQPTTVAWTPTDGTCASPGGSLAVTFDPSQVDYSGSPAGSYPQGAVATGSFTSKPGFVIDGEDGPFSHTFAVTGAPCEAAVSWVPTDGDCVNPGGTLAVDAGPFATYSGDPSGSYLPGTTAAGTFTPQSGYTIVGTTSFSHTFAIVDAPCELPARPAHTAVCGRLTLSNPLGDVPAGHTQRSATFTVDGVEYVVTPGAIRNLDFAEDQNGGQIALRLVYGPLDINIVIDTNCVDDRIEPPQLVAAYDCVTGTSSYTLTPSTSPTWTAGTVSLSGTTYTVTITANAGYTFGTPSVTLTASFTVDDDCERTVVAPEVTPPTCTTPGSVQLPTSDAYTWTTNSNGTYTAVPTPGVELVGQTTFGPFDLAQLTGDACQEPRIDVAAFAPVCQADVPYISYHIAVTGTPSTTADLTFIDIDGDVVATHNDVPFDGTVIYPGATANPQDWPGWKFQNNQWVPDPTDDEWRQGLTVRVEVNPTAIGQVSYPPATAACNGPGETESQAPTTTTGPTTQLPATGSSSTTTATTWALLLLAGGGALTLFGRRSRSASRITN